jgi:hypothetical protein
MFVYLQGTVHSQAPIGTDTNLFRFKNYARDVPYTCRAPEIDPQLPGAPGGFVDRAASTVTRGRCYLAFWSVI